jgi:hypothetical protein
MAVDSEELPSTCGPGVDERETILGVSPDVICCIHSVVGKDQNNRSYLLVGREGLPVV